jgi:glycosyltransferase involved in cell wall biosynthesis
MKIAYDYQTFSVQEYGGISRYYYQLSKNISITNNDVGVFAPIHMNHYANDLHKETIHGLYVKAKYLNKIPKRTKVLGAINRIVSKRQIALFNPDIVHETFYSKHKTYKKAKCTVITVYDMIHELYDYYLPPHHKGWNEKREAINRADHIICISEHTRKDLVELFGIEEEKTSVVHLAYDNSVIVDDELDNERPFLLYVGWREWYKNFKPFLKSISRSKSIMNDFDIIAFGGGEFTVEELKLMTELGFRNGQVRQISGSDKLLAKYYSQARAFIFPSLYEGFGLPPLEAMSYNCPVISSNASCMPEVIGDAAEYFNPNSLDEILESVEKTVYSDSRISELVLLGKQQIEKYSWQKCASETLSVYQSII